MQSVEAWFKNLSKKGYNKYVRMFFIKMAILASCWFIFYHIILKPDRIIDRPLTNFLTSSVTKVIKIYSDSPEQFSWRETPGRACSDILKNGVKDFGVWDVCNGIDLMFIYVSILVLLPYSVKRKLIFGVAGIAAIIFANIIRIASLHYIYNNHKNAFTFSQHYLFTLFMYVLIFYGWYLFTKKDLINDTAN